MYLCTCDMFLNMIGIGTRTARWLNLTNHLTIHNSNYETVKFLLSSKKVKLFIINLSNTTNKNFYED